MRGDGCSATCQSELIPGRGSATSDCTHEWLTTPVPPADRDPFPGIRLECIEGDPTCDFGLGGDNACTFHVALCFNVTERRLACVLTDVARVQLRRPNQSSPRDAVDQVNRDAIEAALAGLSGVVRGRCAKGGPKEGQGCSTDADCDSGPNSGDGKCGDRLVVFEPPLTATDRCTPFVSITVPLRQVKGTLKTGKKTLRLTASPSNDPITGKRRPKDTDVLKLICRPAP